jgi:hypothetical protein
MEKEEPGFELPEDKASRVQQAKFDFSGALSHSYLISDAFSSSDETESLLEIAAACGASEEEIAGISGEAAMPPSGN